MTKEDIEELIQQTKPEFLNEKVIKESGLETACSQSYAKGWNACNKYWIQTLRAELNESKEKNMNREKQITESIKHLEQIIDESTRDAETQEQVTNMALTGIMHNLIDINMTLAIIADELKEEK